MATWSPTEILLWVPTAPSYPFRSRITLVVDRRRAQGGDFTITPPTPGQDNLLANGSFEYSSSAGSTLQWGYTYGQTNDPRYTIFNGYSDQVELVPVLPDIRLDQLRDMAEQDLGPEARDDALGITEEDPAALASDCLLGRAMAPGDPDDRLAVDRQSHGIQIIAAVLGHLSSVVVRGKVGGQGGLAG